LTAVSILTEVLWYVKPCGLIHADQFLKAFTAFFLRISWRYVANSPDTLVRIYDVMVRDVTS